MIKRLRRGIRNLIYWFPVIWGDYHWDHFKLWEIIRHKLKAISTSTHTWITISADEKREELDKIIGLFDDLIDNKYEDELFALHKDIFGESRWEFIKSDEFGPEFSELKIDYPDAEDEELARRGVLTFGRLAELQNRIAINAIFDGMKRSDRWWD